MKEEIYAIKTNNFNLVIMRVQDVYFQQSPPWSGDFQQNANKVDFILKVHILRP